MTHTKKGQCISGCVHSGFISSSKAENIPEGTLKAHQRHKKVGLIEREGQACKVKWLWGWTDRYLLRVNYGLVKRQGSEHRIAMLKREQGMMEECDCYGKFGQIMLMVTGGHVIRLAGSYI